MTEPARARISRASGAPDETQFVLCIGEARIDATEAMPREKLEEIAEAVNEALRAAEARGFERGRNAAANYIGGLSRVLVRDEEVTVRRENFVEWATQIRVLAPEGGR